ncbi:MAG: glutaminase, partial [Bacteroidales bacterium]|nr:glutaminase [Bacteroidales bacterium]
MQRHFSLTFSMVMISLLLFGCSQAHSNTAVLEDPAAQEGEIGFPSNELQQVVDKAYAKYKDLKEGKNADYIPILATVPSDLFGVIIATCDGAIYAAGDIDYTFSIQSVSKPFTAALVMQQKGPEAVAEKIGVEPTGMPFNSKIALELLKQRSVNPSVNAGAIAAVSMVEASSQADRWQQVLQNLSDFAGRDLKLMQEVYDSEYSTSWSNRA